MNTIWKIISMLSFGLLVYQVCFQRSIDSKQNILKVETENIEPLICMTEEMPRFPGCEYSGLSKNERQKCSNKKLLEFVYSNIKYPSGYGCIEGMSLAQFMILKDGSLVDIKIRKSLSPQFDNEIVKMLKTMPRWAPGKQFGKEVDIRFTLPIKIRLE